MCNSFSLVAATFDPLGMMVDPRASRANHSCKPNVCMVYDGSRVQFRALEPFEPGREILVSYVDTNMPFRVRQAALKSTYHFTCTCARCALGVNEPGNAFLPLKKGFMAKPELPNFPSFTPKKMGQPKDPQYAVGDTQEQKLLGSLQEMAYDAMKGKLKGPYGLPGQEAMMDLLFQTGAWKLTRAPLPELLRVQMVAWLSTQDYDVAFVAALKLHCHVDPMLYPEPFHPVRVVNSWTLLQLMRFLSTEEESILCQYCRQKGLDLPIATLPLLKEIHKQAAKSHGRDSAFGRMVGESYQQFMAQLGVASMAHTVAGDHVHQMLTTAGEAALSRVMALVNDKNFEEEVGFEYNGQ